MIEGLVEKLLLSYFGDYIDNLDKNKLKVGVCTYIYIYIYIITLLIVMVR